MAASAELKELTTTDVGEAALAKAEAERRERILPDKAKIKAFALSLRDDLALPTCGEKAAQQVVDRARKTILDLAGYLLDFATD